MKHRSLIKGSVLCLMALVVVKTAEAADKAPSPAQWQLSTQRWAETSPAVQQQQPAKAKGGASKRIMAGKTYNYFARSTDSKEVTAWQGSYITLTTKAAGQAHIKGLFVSLNELDVTYDDSTVTIKPQVVYKHPTYGDVYLCYVDWNQKAYSSTKPIVGKLAKDGTITLDACGLFLIDGENKGGTFGVWTHTDMHPANAVMTNWYRDGDSTEVYPVYIDQPYDNKVEIVNFANNTKAMMAYVDPDSTIEVPSQFVYNNATYGDFNCYPADWSKSKQAQKGSIFGTSDEKQITLGNWGIFNRMYKSLCPYAYKSSAIVFGTADASGVGGFKLRYPTATPITLEGSGTEADPYLLHNAQEVQGLAQDVNYGNSYEGKYIALAGDIDMSSLTQAYRSIGRTDERPFKGHFDGRGHTISNLTISTGEEPNTGLFGYAGEGCSFKDVNLSGLNLESSGEYAGGLVAQSYGPVTNVHVSGTIAHHNSYGGGIAGGMYRSEVKDCSFSGKITGMGSTGGLVGITRGTHVHDSQVDASVNFGGYYNQFYRGVGGLVGNTLDALQSGVLLSKTVIEDCSMTGSITDQDGRGQIGGLVGDMNGGEMRRCLNTAPISGQATDSRNGIVGGIVGMTYNARVMDCITTNEIINNVSTKATQVGGIVGQMLRAVKDSTILRNCLNTGQVVMSTATGHEGLFGGSNVDDIELENCFYDNQITSAPVVDSLASKGKTTAQLTAASGIEGYNSDVWQFTEGLYPQLKKFVGTTVSNLGASPVTLAAGDHAGKVKKNFTASTQGGMEWYVYNDNGLAKENDAISITDSTVTLKSVSAKVMLAGTNDSGKHVKFVNVVTVNPAGFVGQGTKDDPYLIRDKSDLITLNHSVTKGGQSFSGDYFLQTNDIDLNYATDFHGIGHDGNKNHTFDATYDGAGHTIHRLLIDSVGFNASGQAQAYGSAKTAGLFGYCNTNSVIKNLTLAADCKIRGYQIVGGIAAVTLGRIENCRNYADLTCYTDYVGGITAQTVTGSTVTNCYNSGTITAGGAYAGGIVATGAGTTTFCQNDGDVTVRHISGSRTAAGQSTAGGIVASIGGTKAVVTDNVNTGSVTSLSGVGGITSSAATGAQVRRNLNYGMADDIHIDGTASKGYVGAVTGYSLGSKSNSCNYYDRQIAQYYASQSNDNAACVGLLTSELTSGKALDSLDASKYDFTAGKYPVLAAFKDEPAAVAHRQMIMQLPNSQTIDNVRTRANLAMLDSMKWTLTHGQDYKISKAASYYNLQVTLRPDSTSLRDTLTATLGAYTKVIPLRSVPTLFDGSGTEADPFQIKTVADMETLSRFTNEERYGFSGQYFKVMNDIDFTGAANFNPIASGIAKFAADFDGAGHTLSNIKIIDDENDYKALFSQFAGATLHDLTLQNATVLGYRHVAGFVARMSGTGRNLTFNGKVSTPSYPYAGGIVDQLLSGGKLVNCTNRGTIAPLGGSGGGIACDVKAGAIIDSCQNLASQDDVHSFGGIAASNSGTIQNCVNHGTIVGHGGSLGGIVISTAGLLQDCYNDAPITGKGSFVGGVIGRAQASGTSIVRRCYNTADVTNSGTTTGGFAGQLSGNHTVVDCYNTGQVSGAATTGGFAGEIYVSTGTRCKLQRCYNTGTVTADGDYVGGLAANVWHGVLIDSCYNLADVLGTGKYVGGLCGYTRTMTITNSWNAGAVESDSYAVGGLAGYAQADIYSCANVGSVTSTKGTGNKGSYGNAGGLVGYGQPDLFDSYNMGTVTGPSYTGGLLGGAYSKTTATIHRCYNAGEVKSADGKPGATEPDSKYVAATVDSVFYDTDVCRFTPSTADSLATGLTTTQLSECTTLGPAYVLAPGFYPRATTLTAESLLNWWAAVPTFTEGDSAQSVSHPFSIGKPEGTTWTLSSNLEEVDGTVMLLALGKGTLTKTYGSLSKTYVINVTATTGITDLSADAHVVGVTHYDLQGRQVAQPAKGAVIITVTRWSNGAVTTQKVRF